MLDSLLDVGFFSRKEHGNPVSGEIWISGKDSNIDIPADLVINPGEHQNFHISYPDFIAVKDVGFTLRSALAQAGLDCSSPTKNGLFYQIEVKNLHPKNKYLFHKGEIALGRYYKTGENSLCGDSLKNFSELLNQGNNSFSDGEEAKVVQGDLVSIPVAKDFYQIPGSSNNTEQPIDVSNLPPGVERWRFRRIFGLVANKKPYDPKISEGKFRLLYTPLVSVPKGFAMVIQNPDSLNSKVIDGGFEHMIAGEFNDDLLKIGDKPTKDSFLFKIYKVI